MDEHVSADERPHADAPEAVASIETLRDGSVVVPVAEEELLVGKRRRVRERIIVRKRTESREEHVNEEVRRERVEITADDGVAFEDDVARPVRGLASAEERRLRALLTVDDIPMLRNVPVITADDEEVGRVGYIDYEPDTGEIRNVGVSRGFLGLRRLEVSVADALLRPDALQLAYTKQELEALGEGESAAVDEEAAPVGEPTPVEPDSSSLVRHEEELRVERRVREIGNLHAVKHVETEPVHRVAHRDVEHFETVDRQPVDSEDDSGEITMLEDGSISIPVFEEVLIIEKRPMIRERIVIKKESEAERYRVETRLRRERIEADSESA